MSQPNLMETVLQCLLILAAAFFAVFLLGFQSKLMRDDKWVFSYFTSWMITMAQTALTWAIANNEVGIELYLFSAGNGGAAGIVASHFFYRWMDGRKHGKIC